MVPMMIIMIMMAICNNDTVGTEAGHSNTKDETDLVPEME